MHHDDTRGPGPSTIERCVAAHQRTQAALNADEELASDEAAIQSAHEADPTVLTPDELLQRIIRALVMCEARRDEAKALVAMQQARQQRYTTRAEWLREELLEVMFALQRKSFAGRYATASLRDGTQSVVVTDLKALPAKYKRTKEEADKVALLPDLKRGDIITGAVLSNGSPTVALTKPRKLAGPVEEEAEE